MKNLMGKTTKFLLAVCCSLSIVLAQTNISAFAKEEGQIIDDTQFTYGEDGANAEFTFNGKGNPLGINLAYDKAYGAKTAEHLGHTDVDDSVVTSTDELFKIKYVGNWESGPDSGAHGNSEHWADKGTDYYEMKFIGTGFDIYVTTAPKHGTFDVFVDDVNKGQIKATSGKRTNQVKGISVTDLEDTTHTLRVVGTDESKANHLDYIRVYNTIEKATALSFENDVVTLSPGETMELNPIVEPWFISKDNIQWTTSNENVSVEGGRITASNNIKEPVTATITAKLDEIEATVEVKVNPNLSKLNAYVGDENRLDQNKNYNELKNGSRSSFEATTWKNDEVNSKIVVATKNDEIKNITVTAEDLVSESGKKIAKENIEINWLEEVSAKYGRNANGPVENFPDIIHDNKPKTLAKEKVAFSWVNITVPANTPAGTYTGKIKVSADGLSAPTELEYTIKVLDLIQPESESVGVDVQIWQHPFAVANYYLGLGKGVDASKGTTNEMREDFYFTENHFKLMRSSMKEYAAMGGHDLVANIVEEAWNHQSFYKDPSMIKWTKHKDGTWSFDYDWYDKWVQFGIECGIINPETGLGQIKCYSIVPWDNRITYFDEATNQSVTKKMVPGSEEFKDAWGAFLTDFMAHSMEKGWFDITYISMDERSQNEIENAVKQIESITNKEGEHFKISSCMNSSFVSPNLYYLSDRVDDISINLDHYGDLNTMRALTNHRDELGLHTTMYSCVGNYPSNFMISDPVDNYWTIWYAQTLGTNGYLRWAWDNYINDMHGNATYRYWEPGDGWFIYPIERENVSIGQDVGFYSTPRYEMFKQGMRDVSKAKYLIENYEGGTAVQTAIDAMRKPGAGNKHGSATYASEAERAKVFDDSKNAKNVTYTVSQQFIESGTNVPGDHSGLQAKINEVEAMDMDMYTKTAQQKIKASLEAAKKVNAKDDATTYALTNATTALQATIDSLTDEDKVGDKTVLEAEIKKAEAINLDKYIKDTTEVFNDALNAARRVYEGSPNQAEIDQAVTNLKNAGNGLITKGSEIKINKDKVSASSEQKPDESIEKAFDGNKDTIWHSSWSGTEYPVRVTIELDEAQTIDRLTYLPRSSGQNGIVTEYSLYYVDKQRQEVPIIQNAKWDGSYKLQVASFAPVKTSKFIFEVNNAKSDNKKKFASAAEIDLYSVTTGVKEELKAIIEEAKGVDRDQYDDESLAVLDSSLTEAEALFAQENPNIVDVDTAIRNLRNAIDNLGEKLADYSAVEAAKAKIPEDLSIYTDESVKALKDALAAVEEGLKASEQDRVDAMAKAIEDAIQGLQLKEVQKVNKDSLFTTLNKYSSYRSEDYTKETWVPFKEAYDYALSVYQNKNVTQEQVNQAESKLIEAASHLVKAGPGDEVVEGDRPKIPNTGDRDPLGLFIFGVLISSVGIILVLKKIRKQSI